MTVKRFALRTKRRIARFLRRSFGFKTVEDAAVELGEISSGLRNRFGKEPCDLTREEMKSCTIEFAKYYTLKKLLGMYYDAAILGCSSVDDLK